MTGIKGDSKEKPEWFQILTADIEDEKFMIANRKMPDTLCAGIQGGRQPVTINALMHIFP